MSNFDLTAVILAGGKGERLSPVSEILPKPLVPINGKPMIAHLIEQLERIGLRRVIILTGYLSDSVEQFCRTLNSNIEIVCLKGEVELSPAQRLINNESRIGNDFLLLYCDNYINSDDTINKILDSGKEITFLIQERSEGNVRIVRGGEIEYTNGPRKSDFGFVELGYIKVSTPSFFETLKVQLDLNATLSILSHEFSCGFEIVKDSYWSLSNLNRYKKLRKHRKTILLDRDGVLLERMPFRKYLNNVQDYKPMIQNWKVLAELSNLGIDFVVATNQPGLATSDVSAEFLVSIHQKLAIDMTIFGINIISIFVCGHHWNVNCECRKPKPGMLLNAIEVFDLKKSETLYIGDEDKDFDAAISAGIKPILIGRAHSKNFDYESMESAKTEILNFFPALD